VPGGDGVPRFAVLDYKTNWLAGPGEELSAWHHRPEALAAEMQRDHYGLQALLYTAALHRYLRWRLPRYNPSATSPACSTCSCAGRPAPTRR
jgi:exodeoxyribonuclease V beta subunit